jgi:hypothetical protein
MRYLKKYNESTWSASRKDAEPLVDSESIERMFDIELEQQNEFTISINKIVRVYGNNNVFFAYFKLDFQDNDRVVDIYEEFRALSGTIYKPNGAYVPAISYTEFRQRVDDIIHPIFVKIGKKYEFKLHSWEINPLTEIFDSGETTNIEKCDVRFTMVLNNIDNFKNL